MVNHNIHMIFFSFKNWNIDIAKITIPAIIIKYPPIFNDTSTLVKSDSPCNDVLKKLSYDEQNKMIYWNRERSGFSRVGI